MDAYHKYMYQQWANLGRHLPVPPTYSQFKSPAQAQLAAAVKYMRQLSDVLAWDIPSLQLPDGTYSYEVNLLDTPRLWNHKLVKWDHDVPDNSASLQTPLLNNINPLF